MSKHTPGEWKVSSSTMVFVDDGKLKMICNTLPLLYSDVAEEDLPLVQCAANARLIAAAPELLEALKRCREIMMMEHTFNDGYGWLKFINKHIQPILDKAEGA